MCLQNSLTDLVENWIQELLPGYHPIHQIWVRYDNMGGLGKHPQCCSLPNFEWQQNLQWDGTSCSLFAAAELVVKLTLLTVTLLRITKIYAPNLVRRYTMSIWRWSHDQKLKLEVKSRDIITRQSGTSVPFSGTISRMTTCLENLEMSGNLTAVRKMSGILLKIRELSGKKSCQGKVA